MIDVTLQHHNDQRVHRSPLFDTIRVKRKHGGFDSQRPGWSWNTTTTETGERQGIWRCKVEGVSVEILGDNVYVEGSMPKVHWGHNRYGVTSGEVREALGFAWEEIGKFVDLADETSKLRRADIVSDFMVGDMKNGVLQAVGDGVRSRRLHRATSTDGMTGGRTVFAHAGGGGGRLYDKDAESGVDLGGVIRFEAQERHRVRDEPLHALDAVALAAEEDRWERCGYGTPLFPADQWFTRALATGHGEGQLLQAYGYARLSPRGRAGVEKSRRSRMERILRDVGVPTDLAEPLYLDLESRSLSRVL